MTGWAQRQAEEAEDLETARRTHEAEMRAAAGTYIDIVFDGPPAHESGRFVEVEDHHGASVQVGTWIQRPDGMWVLRLDLPMVSVR